MSKIKILPEILANKIAAGEVVERPASVVKELIENSLDAGSSRIIIEAEKGGRSLIRVSDNGEGMTYNDALLAVERYATSKVYKDADLYDIRTLGFRGEALASIASVSRFTLETRYEMADTGARIIIKGGETESVSEIGAPKGTLITVENLFFNTPAREKFLKKVPTEMGHIADTVASTALGRPFVRFRLIHNRKILKDWPPVSEPAQRVADVLGREMRNDLYEIPRVRTKGTSVSGWIASSRFARAGSRGIYVYVNDRFVHDKIVQRALVEGYAGRLMKGQFPAAVIFITLPPDQVDVNVHPRKTEIRFSEENQIYQAVSDAVANVLKHAERPRWGSPPPRLIPERGRKRNDSWPRGAGTSRPRVPGHPGPGPRVPRLQHTPSDLRNPEPETSVSKPEAPYVSESERIYERESEAPPIQTSLWDQKRISNLSVIGQLHNTYILCESDQGLVLIDQHAAHERILFEELKTRTSSSEKQVQQTLIPETVDLGYTEADILTRLIPDLKAIGLEIEPFGGNTFVVKSVPALLGDKEMGPLIQEITEKTAEIGLSSGVENIMNECLSLMACHAAIKANQALSDEQIRHLLTQLEACENPSNCPHGRPVWIRWTNYEIERLFKRIV